MGGVFRVLKPGAHLLSFFGTRTYHRGVVAIEDAGFEIRDQIGWVYGSGFPKSLDVSKAMDRAAGVIRETLGLDDSRSRFDRANRSPAKGSTDYGTITERGKAQISVPTTESAKQWEGWGTGLKPAWEPICVARKPLIGTVAENIQSYGTGAMNIDACRVPAFDSLNGGSTTGSESCTEGWDRPWKHDVEKLKETAERAKLSVAKSEALGRFPANLIHDGSDEVFECFPKASGQQGAVGPQHGEWPSVNAYGYWGPRSDCKPRIEKERSAARFFYCAKASPAERGKGNTHPTVKPLDLIKYLIKLVCPPNGVVLDPFAGSCTTGWAAHELGMNYILIDKDPESVKIGQERLKRETAQMNMFTARRTNCANAPVDE